MPDKLCVVYRTPAAHKAHLLKSVLDDYGIPANVAELSVATEFPLVEVHVSQRELDLATRIVEAFDRHISHQSSYDQDEELDELDIPKIWIEWPTCHSCQTARETSCPYCSTISSAFELADQEWSDKAADDTESDDGEPRYPLLLCHTCSEPFLPKFYRHCAQCNVDQGHGEPAPELDLRPAPAFLSPAIFGWLLIALALVILLMAAST